MGLVVFQRVNPVQKGKIASAIITTAANKSMFSVQPNRYYRVILAKSGLKGAELGER